MGHSVKLLLEGELTPSRFAEVGHPIGAHWRSDGRFVALLSNFSYLYWPARATYEGHRLRHRVSLYAAGLHERLAVFDGARFPINDVAFHPSLPVVAIATGSYDGGHFFEGELLVWNWETGDSATILSENREVCRVAFRDAQTLALLLRPADEEQYGDASFGTFLGGTLVDQRPYAALGLRRGKPDPRIAGFVPVDPRSLQFDCGDFSLEAHQQHWQTALAGADFAPRHRMWDVAWLDPELVLAVHDCCQLEAWTLSGQRVRHFQGRGHGVQLLRHAGTAYVHVLERADARDKSILLRLADNELRTVASFDHAVSFSIDRTGRILCRDTGQPMGQRARCDRVIDGAGGILLERDLGHYDCFNHYLRIDGDSDLYFLRGTPPSSHQAKVLCRIDAAAAVRECMDWDTETAHLMGSTACLLSDGTLIRGYRTHDPNPSRFAGYLEALDPQSGQQRWRRAIPALVTCLAPVTGRPWLLYALTDGRVGVVHAQTGEPLDEQTLRPGGVSTVVLSMDVRANRAACGTLDGRLLMLRLEERG